MAMIDLDCAVLSWTMSSVSVAEHNAEVQPLDPAVVALMQAGSQSAGAAGVKRNS
jgi:hypothetical protein